MGSAKDLHEIEAFIERVITRARIPGRRRIEVREELLSHFEADEPQERDLARRLERFGSEDELVAALHAVYRRDYLLLCVLKVLGAITASVFAAVAVQAALSVRSFDGVLGLSPMFPQAIAISIMVALGLVAAGEATRQAGVVPIVIAVLACALACVGVNAVLDLSGFLYWWPAALIVVGVACSQVRTSWLRVAASIAGFTAAILLLHLVQSGSVSVLRALRTGLGFAVVWASTGLVMALADRWFSSKFGFPPRTAA